MTDDVRRHRGVSLLHPKAVRGRRPWSSQGARSPRGVSAPPRTDLLTVCVIRSVTYVVPAARDVP